MNSQTVFFCKPEELTLAIGEAVAPFTQKLIDAYRQLEPLPSVLSIAWIANDCSYDRATVRIWITKGKKLPAQSRKIKLKVINKLTDSLLLVRQEDYEYFLEWFPAIRARSESASFPDNSFLKHKPSTPCI